jgi:hypothetical protein
MRKLTATICLTLAVLLGSVGCQTTSPISYIKSEVRGSDLPLSKNAEFANETLLKHIEHSGLPECGSSPVANHIIYRQWNRCIGDATYHSGSRYIGAWKYGDKNGYGTLIYSNGRVEEGIWKNDEFQYSQKVSPSTSNTGAVVFGTHVSPITGDKYVGEWKKGRRHGKGTLTYANGSIEKGTWENGEFQYSLSDLPECPADKPTETWSDCSGPWDTGRELIPDFLWKDGKPIEADGTAQDSSEPEIRDAIITAKKSTPPSKSVINGAKIDHSNGGNCSAVSV